MLTSLFRLLGSGAQLARARRLRASSEPALAEAAYRAILERDAEHADAQRELSDLLAARGAGEEALRHGEAALRARPGWAYAHNSIGVALQALGRLDEAIEAFRRALQADPGHVSARVNLGNALLDRGELDAAVEHYRQAVALAPDYGTAHLNLAMALEDDGRYADAVASYERAQALEPSDGIRFKLATLLPVYPRADEIDGLRERLGRQLDALQAQPLKLRDPPREVGQTVPAALPGAQRSRPPGQARGALREGLPGAGLRRAALPRAWLNVALDSSMLPSVAVCPVRRRAH